MLYFFARFAMLLVYQVFRVFQMTFAWNGIHFSSKLCFTFFPQHPSGNDGNDNKKQTICSSKDVTVQLPVHTCIL